MTFNHSSPGGAFPPHSPSRNLAFAAFAAAAAAAAAAVSMSREAHRARCRALARRLEDAAATPVQYMKLKAHAHAYQTHDDDDADACAAFVACVFATCGERFDLIAEVVATTPGVGKRERLAARVEAATRDVVARCGAPARTMAQPHKNYKVERLNDGLVCLRKFLTVEAQEWLAKSAFEVGESDAASAEAGRGFFAKTAAADEGALKLNQGTRGRVIKAVDDFPGETLKELCGEAVRVARVADASLPSGFNPTTVLVNFYKDGAEFKWHKDSEDPKLIASKTGQPIVSFSVGLSADFGYKYSFDDPEHKTVRLNSGDVLLFGGPSRMIVHSVLNVHPGSMPGNMRGKMLNGRLNVTVRDIGTGVIDTSQFPAYRVSYDGVQAEGNV